MEETILNEREINEVHHKCPGCGSSLMYDIASGNLKCQHCGTTRAMQEDNQVQRRTMCAQVLNTHKQWTDGAVFRCSNCGANNVVSKRDISKSCAFCGSNAIVQSQELPGIQPDSVIPFQITQETASQRFNQWRKKRWFVPGEFKKADLRKSMSPMYTPCWSFSAQTQSMYNGTLGRTVSTRNGTRTQWFRVSGGIMQNYTDYFVQSGERINTKNFNNLKPFNLQLVRVYRTEFLSGIVAEHYSRDLEICFQDFAAFVRRDKQQKIMRRHNATSVSQLTINTNYHNRKFNYVLLPVYIAHYYYKNKLYNFYVNGATGKIVGKYPKSAIKITLLVVGLAALVIGVGIAAYFGGLI